VGQVCPLFPSPGSVDRDMSTEGTESTEMDAIKGEFFSGFSDFSGQKNQQKGML